MPKKQTICPSTKGQLFPPTEEEKQAIDEFLAYLQNSGRQTLDKYKTIAPHMRDKATEGMISYWKNACSMLEWARSINSKRRVQPYGQEVR